MGMTAETTKTKTYKTRNGGHDSTKARILNAAVKRFSHYGYGKTTIGEIATDCQMSPGNLYRYFENKLAIAIVLVKKAGKENAKELKKIIKRAGPSAEKQLRACLFGNLSITFERIKNHSKLIEVGRSIHEHDTTIREGEIRDFDEILRKIISKGKDDGIFRVNCIHSTAHIIQCAIHRFSYPQSTAPEAQMSQLEEELEALYCLILTALRSGVDFEIGAEKNRLLPPSDSSQDARTGHDFGQESGLRKTAFF